MKNYAYCLSMLICLVAALFSLAPEANAQKRANDINIDANQDPDSVYVLMSNTLPGKYRYGKFKSVPLSVFADSLSASGGASASPFYEAWFYIQPPGSGVDTTTFTVAFSNFPDTFSMPGYTELHNGFQADYSGCGPLVDCTDPQRWLGGENNLTVVKNPVFNEAPVFITYYANTDSVGFFPIKATGEQTTAPDFARSSPFWLHVTYLHD